MAYIGNEPFVSGNFSSSVHNGTGSELTFAMGQSPGTKNAVLVFIDGLRQVPTIYNVSGSDVVFTAGNAPPSGTSNVQILVSGEELGVNVPADDSVTTVKILDDAVTTDKLADSINTDIAANTAKTGITSGQATAITANTAKVTNATHTGDVTGATALTIADNAVTLAKMAGGTDGNLITYDTSGDPAYVATGSATNVLTSNGPDTAPTFQTAAGGGFSQAQQWRVTTNFSISTSTLYVYANWEKPEAAKFPGSIGSDMVVDSTTSATLSGAWTFPEEGTWLVRWNFYNEGVGGSQHLYSRIRATDDNGANWVEVAKNDSYGFHNQDVTVTLEYMINIDDTTNDKIRFSCSAGGYGMVIRGDTNANAHYATFVRLGDKL